MSGAARVELSLIVVNYHSGEPLRQFFESLRAHPPSVTSELLFVDNSPGDGTAEWIRDEHPEVRVLAMERNRGYAGGVNAGLGEIRGRHVLVVNPDVHFAEGAVDRALDYLRSHSEAGLVGVQLVDADGTPQRNARRFYTLTSILMRRTPLQKLWPDHPALRRHLMLDDDLDGPGPVDWVTGAFMLVRGEALSEVGPMDERFFLYFEDVDWCYRMWELGWEVHFVPEVRLVHGFQRSSTKVSRSLVHHIRSFFGFYDKWGALVYAARHLRDSWSLAAAVVSDLIALNLAFLAAFFVRRLLDPIFPQPLFDLVDYWPLMLSVNLASLIVLPMTGRYGSGATDSRTSLALGAIRATFFVSLLVMSGTWLSYTRTFSRAVLLLFVPMYLGALAVTGWLRERILAGGQVRGRPKRAVIVGGASRFATGDVLEGLPAGYSLAGVVSSDGGLVGGERLLGDLGDLSVVVDRYRIAAVFVGREVAPSPRLVGMLQRLASEGVELSVDSPWNAAVSLPADREGSMPTWTRLAVPSLLGRGAVAKSLLDRLVGLLLAVVSLPGYLVSSTVGAVFGVRTRPVTIEGTGERWRELSGRGRRPLPGWVQLPRFLQVLRGRLSLVGPNGTTDTGGHSVLRAGLAPAIQSGQILDEAAYCERWSLAFDLECMLRQPGALLGAGRVVLATQDPDRPREE
jgi:GT2 family glycosyltransferase